MVCGIHNRDLCYKLADHSIVFHFNFEENDLVSNMTLNMVQPRNILATFKQKRHHNASNIKPVYNVHARKHKTIRSPRNEIQQLLKFLDDYHYVSRYRVCEDGETL